MSGKTPSVSVILPVYNDPDGLQQTVNSLMSQTYDDYELMIINNNSTDETRDIAEGFAQQYPDRVRVKDETEIQSSYAARNTGIRSAKGEILAFIDADMFVNEDWLESGVQFIEDNDASYVACDVKLFAASDSPNFFEKYEIATAFPIETYITEQNFGPTCCIFVRRSVFDQVGLFNPELVSGGDVEFGNSVHAAGVTLHMDGDNVMYHPARASFSELYKKSRRIGRGYAQRRLHGSNHSRSVTDPRNFLPSHPWSFRRRTETTTPGYLLAFYLLHFLLKLVKSTTALFETLQQD